MSQFDENSREDLRGRLKYKSKWNSEEAEIKFEENQVQFIPVQIHNEGQRRKHSGALSGLRSEHCYSRAELRAIKKFNSLFKKIVVLPSKNTLSGIDSSTHIKFTGTSIPEEAPTLPFISSITRTFHDLGHNSKEIQTCESRQNGYGCHTSEKLKQYEFSEECPTICPSRVTGRFSRNICEQNEFEKYFPRNSLLSDEENIGLHQGKSMQCISDWRKNYGEISEDDSSPEAKEVDDKEYTNGFDQTRHTKRRCISEKCVRFHRSEDKPAKKTNSLNLHNNCSACSYKNNKKFYNQNNNIYICSGSYSSPNCSNNIAKPQYHFSSSMKSDSKADYDRNKMINRISSSSQHNESITKSILLTDDTYRNKQECANTSVFPLLMLGNSPPVYNFNTRIIQILSEKRKSEKYSRTIPQEYTKNESLINIQKESLVRQKNENILSCICLKPFAMDDNILIKSIFSLNISGSFTSDKRSFSTLLNILTIPEQKMSMSIDSFELNPTISQRYPITEPKLAISRNVIFSSEEEGKKCEITSRILSCNSSDEEDQGEISKSKFSKTKMNGDRKRKFFHHYEKRRAFKMRKIGKLKDLNSSIKGRMPGRMFSLHKSWSFNYDGYISSNTSVLDIYGEIWPKNIEAQDSLGLCQSNSKSLLTENKDLINATTIIPDIFRENYSGKNIMHDKTSTCIGTNSVATYHPYGQQTSLYPASVGYDVEENDKPKTTKEIKRKLTCKELTRKMVKWIKSLGINSKHEGTIKNEVHTAFWNAEVNLMKQRKVLRSKLRYPKNKTSKLYLHKRDYNETQLGTKEFLKLKTIDPVLKEIPSSEIIEPEYEDEDDEEDSDSEKVEEGASEADKEKRMLVLSEDSIVLSDRKKVYDRLQQCGKLFYTIYLNEKDDWDHVSIRSAESVEHRVGCEDRPFFATYDLGPNDVRVHVTKDVFEERKREPIFKNENYVECQNSQVKLSLMRGKRYTTDLDPTKAKIIEIDCTNQFSEIKICYKKTEPSKECICEYPQVCKTVQLESSELSSLDMNREDKSQDTQELDELQSPQEPAECDDVQELLCEYCRNCHENPETCDNYEKCLEENICTGKKRVTIFSQPPEDVQTVEFCHIQQGFRCSRIDSDEESGKCYWNHNNYSFFNNSHRGDYSKHMRRRYRHMTKKTNHHSKW